MDKSDEMTPDDAMNALFEIFSRERPCKDSGRTYILEIEDGRPVFRRDEICLAIESAFKEVPGPEADGHGDDIVPQKLARLFPGKGIA